MNIDNISEYIWLKNTFDNYEKIMEFYSNYQKESEKPFKFFGLYIIKWKIYDIERFDHYIFIGSNEEAYWFIKGFMESNGIIYTSGCMEAIDKTTIEQYGIQELKDKLTESMVYFSK